MVYFSHFGIVCSLGNGVGEVRASLAALAAGGAPPAFRHYDLRTGEFAESRAPSESPAPRTVPVAAVRGELPEVPEAFARFNSRNNRLLLAALAQIRATVDAVLARFGADRVGVVLGTSNSGIEEALRAIAECREHGALPVAYHYEQQELGSPSCFLSEYLGVRGPCYTISTACSSSARAIISAARLLKAGVVDAVIVGGADALCRLALNGFQSLGALSPAGCRPFSAERDGITIGEAAALTVLTRQPLLGNPPVALLGYGESSDAHHASAPHPEGVGAETAMRAALATAGLTPEEIGYVSLHGTGTPLNDSMEALAVHRVFGGAVPCSSIKHLVGHTLGTCGVVSAAVGHVLLAAPDGGVGVGAGAIALPAHDFSRFPQDASLAPIGLLRECGHALKLPRLLSNSFAFGGNNACLCLGLA